MKYLFLILLLSAMFASTAIAAQEYWILFDNDGYVVFLTAHKPALDGYEKHSIGDIPNDILRGYYKLIDGQFVLDEAKKAQWETENPVTEEPEE
jgi:hypothetical protein